MPLCFPFWNPMMPLKRGATSSLTIRCCPNQPSRCPNRLFPLPPETQIQNNDDKNSPCRLAFFLRQHTGSRQLPVTIVDASVQPCRQTCQCLGKLYVHGVVLFSASPVATRVRTARWRGARAPACRLLGSISRYALPCQIELWPGATRIRDPPCGEILHRFLEPHAASFAGFYALDL